MDEVVVIPASIVSDHFHLQHARGKSTWYHPRRVWPDEIYSMCRRTIVYRFLSNPQNSTNSTGQRKS